METTLRFQSIRQLFDNGFISQIDFTSRIDYFLNTCFSFVYKCTYYGLASWYSS